MYLLLQVGDLVLAESSLWAIDSTRFEDGIKAVLSSLPYESEPLNPAFIILPLFMSFGFMGILFTTLDVLILKSDHVNL